MKHGKTKKTLLGIGSTLLATAATMLVQGSHVEGVILGVVGVGLVVGYDVLDDRTKRVLRENVDQEGIEEVADAAADEVKNDG